MAGLLSAEMKAEMQRPGGVFFPLLELSFPGRREKLGLSAVKSASGGLYEPRIKGWDRYRRQASDPMAANLPNWENKVVLHDSDQRYRSLVERTGSHLIVGSPAVAKIASPNVPIDKWHTWMTGEIGDYAPMHSTEGPTYGFTIRPPDVPLKRQVPKLAVTRADWPNAHPNALGASAPAVYGVHDSLGLGALSVTPNDGYSIGTGMLPTLYLDTVAFTYGACVGKIDVRRVLKDGADLTTPPAPGPAYTISYPIRKGVQWTVVDFSADQGNAAITVDAWGYTYLADGTGGLITDPMDQLRHFLGNFVFNNWRSGAWYPLNASQIDVTSAAALTSFFATRGLTGAGYVNALAEPRDLIDEWCQTWEIRSFWTGLGKIGLFAEDRVLPVPPYMNDPWWRGEVSQAGTTGPDVTYRSEDQLIDRVLASYIYNSALGSYWGKMEARDLGTVLTREAQDGLSPRWMKASI